MKTRAIFIVVGLVVFASGMFAAPGPGVDVISGTDLYEQSEEGFVSLFDGKTLDGWTEIHKHGPPYFVANGVIASAPDAGNDLVTERSYTNFILRMDFKLTAGANNGVGIRTPFEKANLTYVGNEVQILDDGDPRYAHLEPWQYCGSLYNIFPPKRGALNKLGQWNHYEITAQGRHIKVVLNGKTIVDRNINNVTDPQTLREHPGMLRDSGHIALLGHESYVEFRNIRIKELPSDSLPDNTPPEGFTAIFNGRDLAGWEAGNRRGTVQNGAIFLTGAQAAIGTARSFGDFEMLIDWKTGPDAEGGIGLRGTSMVLIYPSGRGGGSGSMIDSKALQIADNPSGEWNRFRILAIGERVHVFLNGQLVVRDHLATNSSATGPIELSTLGGPIWFKNIFIREIPRNAAK